MFWSKRVVKLDVEVPGDYDSETKLLDHEMDDRMLYYSRRHRLSLKTKFGIGLFCLLSIFSPWAAVFHGKSWSYVRNVQLTQVTTQAPHCHKPVLRQEWRDLSTSQKRNYISAVQCLADRPSLLSSESSLYDDFPWIHKDYAAKTHLSATFLPWHRLFIHAYERALKEECGFQGALPYWDWSLDWAASEQSPVWDNDLGFGGDGDSSGPESVGDGRCVTKGPFSELKARYYDGEYLPHCLSRGFPDTEKLRELGKLIEPAAIQSLMHESDYATFEKELEHRAHHFLSQSVRGELSRFTGPNDPIFFLHHTNIDRLWWRWQQADMSRRMYAYNGRKDNVTDSEASLIDVMDMAGLTTDAPVVQIMDTQGTQFCYTY